MKFTFSLNDFVRSLSRPHPIRDWFLLIILGAGTLISLVTFAVYYFLGIQSGSIIGDASQNVTPIPRVSRVELQEVVDVHTLRAVNYEEGEISIPDISDPSL
ncbi:MAG: hypothetical protein AAB439_00740 [Patescibacteria group bacterium]